MAHTAKSRKPRKGPVLLVDDNRELRNLFGWLLTRRDVKVRKTGNVKKAVSLLKQRTFDMVISDYRMPVMTGLELLKLARTHQPSATRVLLTAQHPSRSALRKLKALGARVVLKQEGIRCLLSRKRCRILGE